MTLQEMAQIIDILALEYPQIANRSDEEKIGMMQLWTSLFADEPGGLVGMAVKIFLVTDTSGFPPKIGQIKAIVRQLQQVERPEMTELEAWTLVEKATRNGLWGAQQEFEKLPDTLKRLVGSPQQLQAWSRMDADKVAGVVASNFQRSYRARKAQEREFLALPPDIRQALGTGEGGILPALGATPTESF